MDELELIRAFRKDDTTPNPVAREAARERLSAHIASGNAPVQAPTRPSKPQVGLGGPENSGWAHRSDRVRSAIARFAPKAMLWFAGADDAILAKCPVADRRKHIAVGATVLTTGVLMAVAGTYLTKSLLQASPLLAIVVGVLLGAAVVILDRSLHMVLRRERSVLLILASGVPRVVLAIAIGLIISEPLMLDIFHNEVAAQAVISRQAALTATLGKADRDYAAVVPGLERRRDALKQELVADGGDAVLQKNAQYQLLVRKLAVLKVRSRGASTAARCEFGGACRPAIKRAEKVADLLRVEVKSTGRALTRLRQRLLAQHRTSRTATLGRWASVQADLTRLKREHVARERQRRMAAAAPISLLERKDALSHLARSHTSLRATRWTVELLIVLLASLPVLMSIMLLLGKGSTYDRLSPLVGLSTPDRRVVVDLFDVLDLRAITDEADLRRDLQGDALRDLTRQVVDAQKAVAESVIADWKEELTRERRMNDVDRHSLTPLG